MAQSMPKEDVERIVGVPRSQNRHIGKAVSADQTCYILHSQNCLDSGIDLLQCPYTLAMDEGVLGVVKGRTTDQARYLIIDHMTGALALHTLVEVAPRIASAPSIGRIVHYVERTSECMAAIVTDVGGPNMVSLAGLTPTGLFFRLNVPHAEEMKRDNSWHWPERV